MGEDDPQCAAPLPEHPAQVRHRPHHAEDVAVAVVELVDGVDARERYKKQRPSSHGCQSAMARKRKRTTTRRRRPVKRRKKMEGGKAPFLVDFKKGFDLITDKRMWSAPSKADYKRYEKQARDYKRQHRASGTKDSYNDWVIKKGYAKKSGCAIM